MEKIYTCIGGAILCITLSFDVSATDQKMKPEIPDYWLCNPVMLEIDYSYLKAGEWIGKEFREKVGVTIAKIHNYPSDAKRTWGLVNCMF